VEGLVSVGNNVNTNVVGTGSGNGGVGYGISNDGNGGGSTNNGEITDISNTEIDLDNEAYLNNKVNADLNTGGNKITDNLSGDGSTIKTGNATSTSSMSWTNRAET
jgi:hypothetical protein